MKTIFNIAICSILILLFAGCEEEMFSPAKLTVRHIGFTETYSNTILDFPNGVVTIDNPNFNINNPQTWTGSVEKYVKHNYFYSVSYNVKNIGGRRAYDVEIDLHYIYDNGDEEVETIYIGDIRSTENFTSSTTVGCSNKQLIQCNAEVFWYD